MLGIVGVHRAGKSTLAQALSEKTGLPYLSLDAGSVFAELGISPSASMPFAQRLYVQRQILNKGELLWRKHGVGFVTDRTPVDMLAYTLADAGMNTLCGEEEEAELQAYTDACVEATKRHFHLLFLLQPGIPLVHAENKGAMSAGYRMHLNWLMRGLMTNKRLHVMAHIISDEVTSFQRRLEIAHSIYAQYCAKQAQSAKAFSAMTH